MENDRSYLGRRNGVGNEALRYPLFSSFKCGACSGNQGPETSNQNIDLIQLKFNRSLKLEISLHVILQF